MHEARLASTRLGATFPGMKILLRENFIYSTSRVVNIRNTTYQHQKKKEYCLLNAKHSMGVPINKSAIVKFQRKVEGNVKKDYEPSWAVQR